MRATLYYVHDPMCSWCWAFAPTLEELLEKLPPEIEVKRLLGGLAPDTDEPMPEAMREQLQLTWQRIEQTVPGTRFNFDFWRRNTPRRATYPACRALLAARQLGMEKAMLNSIQEAYYRQARNPSDKETLVELAREIGLKAGAFEAVLESEETAQQLEEEIRLARSMGADSFPSLVLKIGDNHWPVPIDYNNSDNMLANIEWMFEG